jgi:uncharacterized protein YecE (DUF72 family)
VPLYIGTSGWAYAEWKPDFYPGKLPQSRYLEHYGSALSACEVNATFYRAQSEETLQRWTGMTPEPFRFAVKAHRALTYSRTMIDDGLIAFYNEFLESVAPLGGRLGPVLLQFPKFREHDDESLARLLDALPDDHSFAFEFRHESWDAAQVSDELADSGATSVVSDEAGECPDALPPGKFAYVRLRANRYSSQARAAWSDLLREESQQRDVYVFTKHKAIPVEDSYGGIGLSLWLQHQLGAQQRPASG